MDAVLIATDDSDLRTAAERSCAALGATAQCAAEVATIRRLWRSAAAVVVGSDAVGLLERAGLPRRADVFLLGRYERLWREGVAIGAAEVFCLPDDDAPLIDALGVALDGGREACLISVVGGVGGVWASTFAVSVGLAGARRELRSLLLDVDPLGGGADLVLGAERAEGLRWPQIDGGRGRLAGSITELLPARDGLATMSWTRQLPRSVPDPQPVLSAAIGGFDLVVSDVPRHIDAVGAQVLGRSVVSVVLVPTDVRGLAASRLVVESVGEQSAAVVAVACARSGGVHHSEVARLLDVPVVGRLKPDRRVRAAIDVGHGPGTTGGLRKAADSVLELVGLA